MTLRDIALFFLLSLHFVEFNIQEDKFPHDYSLLPQSVLYDGSLEGINICSAESLYYFILVWETLTYAT